MKKQGSWSTAAAAILLVAPAAVSTASERSTSALGLGPARAAAVVGPPATRAADFAGTPVPDGSFENGPPPDSDWTEFLDTVACGSSIGDWSAFWDGLEAPDGQLDFWAGGLCGETEVTNSIVQEIVVPLEDPILIFWFAAARDDADQPPGSDVAYLALEGIEVASLDLSTSANDTVGEIDGQPVLCFVPFRVDLSLIAGQTVELEVGFEADGSGGVGNARFDAFGFADLVSADGFECGTSFWEVIEEPEV